MDGRRIIFYIASGRSSGGQRSRLEVKGHAEGRHIKKRSVMPRRIAWR